MRTYTQADVEALFAEYRALVLAQAESDPDAEDYSFRMDALIRFWLLEMHDHGSTDEDVRQALREALRWARCRPAYEVFSATVH
jgi:hypothetical protein